MESQQLEALRIAKKVADACYDGIQDFILKLTTAGHLSRVADEAATAAAAPFKAAAKQADEAYWKAYDAFCGLPAKSAPAPRLAARHRRHQNIEQARRARRPLARLVSLTMDNPAALLV